MNRMVELLVWIMYFIGLYFAIFWIYSFVERYESLKEEAQPSCSRKLRRSPKVSVIIPAYNAAATIKDCLLSVISLDYPKEKLEIILVNDGSTDNTATIVSEITAANEGVNVKLLNQENLGKGRAMNNALAVCSGEFFACLDSDSLVEPETLRKMLYVFEQHGPELAIVTPAMKVFKPKSFIHKFQRIEYIFTLFINRLASHFDSLYVAPGPFSIYKTGIIEAVGGFDERNLTEDQEIGYRMQKHHYLIKHCFDAYVYTVAPGNMVQLYRQRSRWWRGSLLNFWKYRALLMNPKYGHFGVFQLPLILLGYLTVWLVIFFFGYFTLLPWWRGLYDLRLTGFDILTMLKHITFSFDILKYDIGTIFLTLVLMLFTIVTFLIAHRSAKEGFFKYGFLYLPFFFLVYYLMLSFIYVAAAVQLIITRRNDKWLGKSI